MLRIAAVDVEYVVGTILPDGAAKILWILERHLIIKTRYDPRSDVAERL